MSLSRKERLKKVLKLQEKLTRLHETRHAMHLSSAAAAEREADEIRQRMDSVDSLSEVFPEIYHRRVASANQRRLENLASARAEAGQLATANARTDIVQRNYREALWHDERQRNEKDVLEEIERRSVPRK